MHGSQFVIRPFANIAELQRHLGPMPNEVIKIITALIDKNITVLPKQLEGIANKLALVQELKACNMITLRNNEYHFITLDSQLDKNVINERMLGLNKLNSALANTIVAAFDANIPIIHIEHADNHWTYLRSALFNSQSPKESVGATSLINKEITPQSTTLTAKPKQDINPSTSAPERSYRSRGPAPWPKGSAPKQPSAKSAPKEPTTQPKKFN